MGLAPTRRAARLKWISRLTLLALLLGLAGGALMARLAPVGREAVLAVADPTGKLWLDGLTMTIVPLVFGLLVNGVASAASGAAGNSVATRAVTWFALLLLGACLLAAAATSTALHVFPVPAEAMTLHSDTPAPELAAPGAWLAGLVPTNPIKAAADGAIVPLVIFALLFGLAAVRIESQLSDAILTFFRALVETMLVIVGWVLVLAPLGVFALSLGVGARVGLSAAGALVHYILIAAGACCLATVLAYGAAIVAGRISPLGFARAALPAQVVALSTQSSLATLPAMIASAPALRVSAASAAIILPLAVSLFRAASAAANVAVAIYLAHLHAVPLTTGTILLGALVAVPISLAAVGLPAQVSFFATIGPVCLAMGVPLTLLPLLLAVETIPDIFRTLGNVTADLAVLRIAGAPASDRTSATGLDAPERHPGA
ncbi:MULTISPECIES: dicarboxylate/amino acid:cation symporter [unclassified Sphingomonas]|uniref:dicarboxylate/amino acid:cation symporter n=1 Tax=unclassified Sphingomonas TaxID=196159 RepID=UPI000A43D3FD|nr:MULTISPECIES: cation:dicarboxylase symporter family transporter [unclassified Sphingomonas]